MKGPGGRVGIYDADGPLLAKMASRRGAGYRGGPLGYDVMQAGIKRAERFFCAVIRGEQAGEAAIHRPARGRLFVHDISVQEIGAEDQHFPVWDVEPDEIALDLL